MTVIDGKNEDLRIKDNYLQQLESENEEKARVIQALKRHLEKNAEILKNDEERLQINREEKYEKESEW